MTTPLTTHKQVQQILANELGVDRAFVRQVIEERVDKLLRTFSIDQLVKESVEKSLRAMAKDQHYDRDSIRSIAEKVAKEFLQKRLTVAIKEHIEGGGTW